MPTEPSISRDRVFRFGSFELSEREAELRKSGVRIKLQEQPFRVLVELVANAGKLVSREDLHQKLWPSDTFVDFDVGLNSAIRKLRQALNDDADHPHYIETLAKRGYRFVAPVTEIGAIIQPPPAIVTPLLAGATRKRSWVVGLALAALCVLGVAGFHLFQYWTRVPKVLKYRQLTADGQLKRRDACSNLSPLATDGPRVFFSEPDSSISQVSAAGGEVVNVPTPFLCFVSSDISPDRTELLGIADFSGAQLDQPLWRFSLSGGQAYRVGNLSGHAPAWAPDGERIVYATGNDDNGPADLYVARKDGSEPRKLFRMEKSWVISLHWSPAGNVVRMVTKEGTGRSLWEFAPDGTAPHRISLFPGDPYAPYQHAWTPDGRYSLLTAGGQIWALPETKSFLGRNAKPVQLTAGPMRFASPTASPDGRHIFALGGLARGQLVRYDLKLQRLELYLSGMSVEQLDFSWDGKWVAYEIGRAHV